MWIVHKCKGGETLEEIAAKYKTPDIKPYLKLRRNKKAAAQYRKKVSFEKGTTITILDPKSKYYVIEGPKGKMVLTDKEWKQAQTELKKAMGKVAQRIKMRLDMLEGRHQAQLDVNAEFPVVAFFSSTWVGNAGREPVQARKAAQAAMGALTSIANAGKYSAFEAAVRKAEAAVNKYSKELQAWIDKLIGSSGNWVKGLTVTKEVSFVIFSAAAVTVAAPVGYAATVATGMGVGGGTAFLKSGADQVGRVISGEKVTLESSTKKIGKDAFWGVIGGGFAGGLGKWIGGHVAPKLAQRLIAYPLAQKVAMKMVMGSARSPVAKAILGRAQTRMQRVILEEMLEETGRTLAKGTVLITSKELNMVVATTMAKFVVRLGVGGVVNEVKRAMLRTGDGGSVAKTVERRAMTMKGKVNDAKVADAVVHSLMKDAVVYDCYSAVFASNQAKIETEIDKELRRILKDKLDNLK
ncbi:MAG: hypothetical protein AB3N22_21660 [Ruegeria sp.]